MHLQTFILNPVCDVYFLKYFSHYWLSPHIIKHTIELQSFLSNTGEMYNRLHFNGSNQCTGSRMNGLILIYAIDNKQF